MKHNMITVSCLFISVQVYGVMSFLVPDPECKDVYPSCHLFPQNTLCVDGDTHFAWNHCRLTCNYCNKSFCDHEGTKYLEGEIWKDGCRTVCMCDDAMNNIFKCRPPCLDFQHLPSECRLEEVNNLCCEQPRCSGDIAIHIPVLYMDEYPGYNYTATFGMDAIIVG